MAYPYGNKMYDKGRNGFAKGDINWKSGGDTFRAYLVDLAGGAGYTPDFAADEFLSAIPSAALKSYVALAPADPAGGICDAADVVFSGVAAGDPCEAIVIAKWVTEAADSPLIAYIDSATGLPVTPNGGNLNVGWDNGANKIFKL